MADKVLMIQGSKTDDPYVDQIVSALAPYNIQIERRIASAHRTPLHLQRILDYYEDRGDRVVAVTTAGLSDALSGTVAARYSGRTVACHPDFEKHGDAKIFSSAATPKGIEVKFARNPHEAADLVHEIFSSYDFSRVGGLRKQAEQKRIQTMIDDAVLQGVEEPPLPYTVFKRGKTRDVYDLGDGTLAVKATNRVSAFDVILHERVPRKGRALTELSEYWFQRTQHIIPNHFIKRVDDETIRVKKAKRIDIEWIVRGYLYGSLWRAYQRGERMLYGITLPDGLELASEFPQPILTATTKAETGHDMPLTKEEAVERGLVKGEDEWDMLAASTLELYEFYREHAKSRGIIIPDFKLEFGVVGNEYSQIDEPPNHDSARLWADRFYRPGEKQEGHALDKEFLRQYLLEIGYNGDGEPPHLPEIVVDQISRRCTGAAEIVTGKKTDVAEFGLKTVEEIIRELHA